MTWNCVTGEKIRIRVMLWGDGCHVCEKSACLTQQRLYLPSAASTVFLSFVKKKSLRGPHRLHSEITSKHWGAWSLSRICYRWMFLIPSPALLTVLLPDGGSSGSCEDERWLRSGMVSSLCSPSKLLMCASGQPHELSNYWITARSEVVT